MRHVLDLDPSCADPRNIWARPPSVERWLSNMSKGSANLLPRHIVTPCVSGAKQKTQLIGAAGSEHGIVVDAWAGAGQSQIK
jgi:hypothetical protein